MSLTSELQNISVEAERIDLAIADLIRGVSVSSIINDPAFDLSKAETACSKKESPQNLTIYQLNTKLKELEDADSQLKEFWVIKNLFREVELALELASGTMIISDKDELWSIVQNFQKIDEKIKQYSEKKLAICLSMKDKYESMAVEFNYLLNKMFNIFLPKASSKTYTFNGVVTSDEGSLKFEDFVEVANTFESLHSLCKIPEMINQIKLDWDQKLLEPLMSQLISLRFSMQKDGSNILEVGEANLSDEIFMSDFLYSLQCFARFVNVGNLRSLKNHFTSKISNGLMDLISANITIFTRDEHLIELLLETLELFSSSGWTLPLRNIFSATSDVRKTLKGLHLDWITDKYIDQLRSLFNDPLFGEALLNQHSVSHTVEIQSVPVKVPQEVFSSSLEPSQDIFEETPEEISEEAGEVEWDNDWGSDEDDNFEVATKASNSTDAWDDNWDESWSDDDGVKSVKSMKFTRNTHVQVPTKLPTKSPAKSSAKPNVQTPRAQENSVPTQQNHYETYSIVLSSISHKLTTLLEKWKAETDDADNQILMDTIFSLALTSYPRISQSFLLLNDLRSVECQSSYLKECADTELKHFRQRFATEVAKYLSKPNSLEFNENNHTRETSGYESIDQIKKALSRLFNSDLQYTNAQELKSLVLHVLDLINNLVLQKIFQCEEITEYQSEEFTRYLEILQDMDSNTLAKLGSDPNMLTTTNRVMQTKFLINNHLKSIMECFYHGEFYEFSTDELVIVIKSVFVPSELRENCIREIIDVRSN